MEGRPVRHLSRAQVVRHLTQGRTPVLALTVRHLLDRQRRQALAADFMASPVAHPPAAAEAPLPPQERAVDVPIEFLRSVVAKTGKDWKLNRQLAASEDLPPPVPPRRKRRSKATATATAAIMETPPAASKLQPLGNLFMSMSRVTDIYHRSTYYPPYQVFIQYITLGNNCLHLKNSFI